MDGPRSEEGQKKSYDTSLSFSWEKGSRDLAEILDLSFLSKERLSLGTFLGVEGRGMKDVG